MRLPVPSEDGQGHLNLDALVAVSPLVKVRLTGSADAVEAVAGQLHDVLTVTEMSADYPRRDLGVRRYPTVLPDSGLPPAPAGRSPER